MENYNQEFMKALEFSKKENLYETAPALNAEVYIQEWLMYDLGPKIAENFTREGFVKFLSSSDSALRLHHLFKPIVDKLLNIDSMITTGYVTAVNDANEVEDFGRISEEEIKTSLEKKIFPEKLHNWLTLPSGEIIDLAFMTIYGLIYNEDSLIGNIVAKDPRNFTGGMEYHPMFVGEAFYELCQFDFTIDFDALDEEES